MVSCRTFRVPNFEGRMLDSTAEQHHAAGCVDESQRQSVKNSCVSTMAGVSPLPLTGVWTFVGAARLGVRRLDAALSCPVIEESSSARTRSSYLRA